MATATTDHQRLRLNDVGDMEVNIESIGDQKFPLLVVDNLYQDPSYVRDVALSMEYSPPQRAHPGMVAKLETDIAELHKLVWEHVGKPFGYSIENAINRSSFPGMTFMKIHRAKEDLTIHQCRPHADPVRIAGVIYLNLPEHCVGGTAFFKHRASGAEACVLPRQKTDPFDQQFIAKARELGAFESYDRYCREMFAMPYLEFIKAVLTTMPREKDYPTDSNEDWEMTRKVEMKFNRLVCYPGFLIHAGYYRYEWFGDDITEQRLTQNVFIN